MNEWLGDWQALPGMVQPVRVPDSAGPEVPPTGLYLCCLKRGGQSTASEEAPAGTHQNFIHGNKWPSRLCFRAVVGPSTGYEVEGPDSPQRRDGCHLDSS